MVEYTPMILTDAKTVSDPEPCYEILVRCVILAQVPIIGWRENYPSVVFVTGVEWSYTATLVHSSGLTRPLGTAVFRKC